MKMYLDKVINIFVESHKLFLSYYNADPNRLTNPGKDEISADKKASK